MDYNNYMHSSSIVMAEGIPSSFSAAFVCCHGCFRIVASTCIFVACLHWRNLYLYKAENISTMLHISKKKAKFLPPASSRYLSTWFQGYSPLIAQKIINQLSKTGLRTTFLLFDFLSCANYKSKKAKIIWYSINYFILPGETLFIEKGFTLSNLEKL